MHSYKSNIDSNSNLLSSSFGTVLSRSPWRSLPQLKLADFSLRPLHNDDINAWFNYLHLPIVIENTSWDIHSAQDLLGLIANYNSNQLDASIRFAIQDNIHQYMIGSIGFHTISDANKTAELAYDLHPDFWGRGIMTASCQAMLTWGKSECGFNRIQATVLPENNRSIEVLNRCEFLFEGRLRQLKKVRGISKDFLLYSKIFLDNIE